MEWLLVNNFVVDNISSYNCSESAQRIIEWKNTRPTKDYVNGTFSVVYGIFALLMYAPCLIVLRSKANWKTSCFKIMFYLGIGDMGCLVVNSVITGVLLVHGTRFCTSPIVIYTTGAFGIALWCNSCMACFVLAFNRLLDLWKPHLMDTFFKGIRTYIWLLLCTAYFLYFLLFTRPLIFSPKSGAWFFDPYITKDVYEYTNFPHTANNLIIVCLTMFLYICYVVILKKKYTEHNQDVPFTTNPIFLQCMLICLAHVVASLIYVYMNFFDAPIVSIRIGHISWQLSHGIPCFIYIFINKSMRRDVNLLLQGNQWRSHFTTKTELVNPKEFTYTVHADPYSEGRREIFSLAS